jgi:hypothetical protein
VASNRVDTGRSANWACRHRPIRGAGGVVGGKRRVFATDWLTENPEDDRDGWTLNDTVRLAKELLAHGVDLLNTSSGGITPDARISTGAGYQVPSAARVKADTDLSIADVGEITDPHQADDVIASGRPDAVLLGRELLRDRYRPNHAARELGATPHWPAEYRRAQIAARELRPPDDLASRRRMGADEVGVVMPARLDRAGLGGVVDVHQTEPLVVAVGPLEVVEQ